MKPSELNVDIEMKALLSGRISVDSVPVPVYAAGEKPTTGVPDDFIEIFYNGYLNSISENRVIVKGAMAVVMSNRLFEDGSVKTNRVKKLLQQFEDCIDGVSTTHYFLKLSPDGFITPTTENQTTGYSTTILNVEWRTLSTTI